MDLFSTYSLTVSAFGAMALLMLVQIGVNDYLGITNRHVPGTPVVADHSNPLFRASRTVANTNESIAVFILAALYGVFQGASPDYLGLASWGYVVARAAYALCYYTNQQTMRSVMFGLSLFALVTLLIIGTFIQ